MFIYTFMCAYACGVYTDTAYNPITTSKLSVSSVTIVTPFVTPFGTVCAYTIALLSTPKRTLGGGFVGRQKPSRV